MKLKITAKLGVFGHRIEMEFDGTIDELKEFNKIKDKLIEIKIE